MKLPHKFAASPLGTGGLASLALSMVIICAAAQTNPVPVQLSDSGTRLPQLLATANSTGRPEEILRLVQAGVDAGVIQGYIESSGRLSAWTADEILQLHRQGVPTNLLLSVIRKPTEWVINTPSPPWANTTSSTTTESFPSGRELTPAVAKSVIYIPHSPRPVARSLSLYWQAPPAYYSVWGWPGETWGYSPYWFMPMAQTYRPAWAYDFRFRGCW